MPVSWIDVADTAVKIGLGALISAGASITVARLNHRKENQKTIISKKLQMVEDISELAEEYFYFFTRLSNRVGPMIRISDNVGKSLTEAQRKIIAERHEGFGELLSKRNKAVALIMILKIEAARAALKSFNDALAEYRDIIVFQKILIGPEQAEEIVTRCQKYRSEFFLAIGNYLESLQNY